MCFGTIHCCVFGKLFIHLLRQVSQSLYTFEIYDSDDVEDDDTQHSCDGILVKHQSNFQILTKSEHIQMNDLLKRIISDLWDLCQFNCRTAFITRIFQSTWVF